MTKNKKQEINLSWNDFATAIETLLDQITEQHKKKPYDVIIGILRGGGIVAVPISYHLGLPLGAIGVDGFSVENPDSKWRRCYGKVFPIKINKLTRVLVVDDVIDRGNTLRASTSFIPTKDIDVCCLVSKLSKKDLEELYPNVFISIETQQDVWVTFPWEIGK